MVGRKALIFTDLQKLQQFIAKKGAKGQRRNTQTAGGGEAAEEMDDVVAYLRRHTVDIAILQKTHLAQGRGDSVQQRMQGQVCAAGFTTHATGVLIWARKGAAIRLQEVCIDPAGYYVVAKYIIGNCVLLVVDIYSPNYDDPNFYYILNTTLQQSGDIPQLWGGNLNCVLNPDKDRSTGPPRRPSLVARALSEIVAREGVVAVWSHQYSTIPGYNHYSAVHDIQTRIDYWLCLRQLSPPDTGP
ncbi:hypothetical protein NDU88_002582 [Pleurodeles waltl]|uniref:Endonuclease/exonuclease/phosphatase domain-containing protein n=1 Tax=Pleurodeles waltl TaxID=8319 RepID=A0AAV7UZ00_PLEWA|nr:hypothetical protein NDU88_002582 [Pleurodeles waltl]